MEPKGGRAFTLETLATVGGLVVLILGLLQGEKGQLGQIAGISLVCGSVGYFLYRKGESKRLSIQLTEYRAQRTSYPRKYLVSILLIAFIAAAGIVAILWPRNIPTTPSQASPNPTSYSQTPVLPASTTNPAPTTDPLTVMPTETVTPGLLTTILSSTQTPISTESSLQVAYFRKDCVPENLWTVAVLRYSSKPVNGCLSLTTYGLDAHDNGFTVALDQTDQSFGIHTPLQYRSGDISFTIQINELQTTNADEAVNLNFGFYDVQATSYFGKVIYISTSSKSPPRVSFWTWRTSGSERGELLNTVESGKSHQIHISFTELQFQLYVDGGQVGGDISIRDLSLDRRSFWIGHVIYPTGIIQATISDFTITENR